MMIKNNKWRCLISSVIILMPVIIGIVYWDLLPQRIVTHWGFDGAADGWSSRAFVVFGFPSIMLAGHWACIFFTASDRSNKKQTRKIMNMIFWLIPAVSFFASAIIYAQAFGTGLNVGRIAIIFVGILFALLGNYFPKIRQNKTIGIRIKWTLENEENWNATHRFGGKVWMLGGIVFMFCAFLPEETFGFTFSAIMVMLVAIPAIYSYAFHRRQQRDKAGTN